jgi:hypothetical protein
MENQIILLQPKNKLGVKAKNLLKTAGIDFTIVLKEADSDLCLESELVSYKGLKEIEKFIRLYKSNKKKNKEK